jgi:hypothetical protein
MIGKAMRECGLAGQSPESRIHGHDQGVNGAEYGRGGYKNEA